MLLKIETESRAILQTGATPAVLAVVRGLEGHRRWLKGGGLAIEPTGRNIELLRAAFPALEVTGQNGAAAIQGWDMATGLGNRAYTPRTPALEHQAKALAKLAKASERGSRHFALFMEQGTGKTWVAITHAGNLHAARKITGVLVVAPKGVHRQWVDSQVSEHYGAPYTAAFWPLKELPRELLPGEDLKWLTINIDGIKGDKGAALCSEFIKQHQGRVLMVLDESHQIKNASTSRWKSAKDLGQRCAYRMALTGTPIAKDLTDEWSQLKWLDESILGIRYVSAFRNEYCIMGGFEGRVVIGHKNVERFKERTAPFMFRATKEEIGIMPPMTSKWTFDLTSRQKGIIRSIKQDLIAGIDSGRIVSAANGAVGFLRMQQVSNGWYTDEDEVVQHLFTVETNPRIVALIELLNSIEGKAVIWARFREDIRQIECALRKIMGDRAVVTYHGGTSDKDRKVAVDNFLSSDGPRYFVSNPSAGGTGLNLQGACRNGIYYSNSDNAIERWQSEARIHRIGTIGAITNHDLIAIGGVDRPIIRRTAMKHGVASMALGDFRKMLEEEL